MSGKQDQGLVSVILVAFSSDRQITGIISK